MPQINCENSIENDTDKMVLKGEESNSMNSLSLNGNIQLLNQTKSDESLSMDNNLVPLNSTDNSKPCLNTNNSNNTKHYIPIVKKIISKLEDMKVSDLKAELKKRNLPVSGAKQQLIERLKPFSDSVVSTNNSIVTAELSGTTSIFNFSECKNGTQLTKQDILNNNSVNTNFNTMGTSLAGPATFILKNSNEVKKGISSDELLFITNNSDNFSTIPLQLKQPNSITLDAPTLTIPITNTFIPQYQIISSAHSDKINLSTINLASTPNTIQAPMTNNILVNNKLNIINPQPSIISTNLNYNQVTNSIGKNSNLTILTGEPIQLGPVKNGLSFNIAQPVPSITNKLVSIQNPGPVFHQLLLYPTTMNPPSQDICTLNSPLNISASSKQRSNSLPSDSLHQLQR